MGRRPLVVGSMVVMVQDLLGLIDAGPTVLHGQVRFKGTRVPVSGRARLSRSGYDRGGDSRAVPHAARGFHPCRACLCGGAGRGGAVPHRANLPVRVKLDENIPTGALVVALDMGHDADTVKGEGPAGAPDVDVLAAATRDRRVLMTLDRRFGDVRAYPPGSHAGIVVLRVESQDAHTVSGPWPHCWRATSSRSRRLHRRGARPVAAGQAP